MFLDREAYSEEYEGFTIRQLDGQQSAYYTIKPPKGPLPDVLTGMYTSLQQAKKAVDVWIRAKKPRVRKEESATN